METNCVGIFQFEVHSTASSQGDVFNMWDVLKCLFESRRFKMMLIIFYVEIINIVIVQDWNVGSSCL